MSWVCILMLPSCSTVQDGISAAAVPYAPQAFQSAFTASGIGNTITDRVVSPPRPPVETAEPAENGPEAAPDEEFYDPFQREEERHTGEESDPLEAFNSVMFEFKRKLDKYVLKPVAQAYDHIVPDDVELAISNAVHNIRFMPRLVNNLLQGKFKGAGIEASRFAINTTLGLGGLLDIAKETFDLDTPDEDSGQTLGFYGIPSGPYLVLPFLPPTTVRDAIGLAADAFLEPMNYFLFGVIRVGQPILLGHQNTGTFATFGERTGEIVNERSINLETFQGVEESTIDLYGAVRNGYLQRRAKQVLE